MSNHNRVAMLAFIDRSKSDNLKKKLIDENLTFRAWLDKQITTYLKKQRRAKS